MTTLHDFEGVLERPLDTLSGLSQYMVTALGLGVKWPQVNLVAVRLEGNLVLR